MKRRLCERDRHRRARTDWGGSTEVALGGPGAEQEPRWPSVIPGQNRAAPHGPDWAIFAHLSPTLRASCIINCVGTGNGPFGSVKVKF